MIRAVLFDMDGILYDSEPYYFRSFAEILSSLGYSGPQERLYEAVGMNEVNTYLYYAGLLEGRMAPEEIKEESGKYRRKYLSGHGEGVIVTGEFSNVGAFAHFHYHRVGVYVDGCPCDSYQNEDNVDACVG